MKKIIFTLSFAIIAISASAQTDSTKTEFTLNHEGVNYLVDDTASLKALVVHLHPGQVLMAVRLFVDLFPEWDAVDKLKSLFIYLNK